MAMNIKSILKNHLTEAQVTDEQQYLKRREFLKTTAGISVLGIGLKGYAEGNPEGGYADFVKNTAYGQNLEPHSYNDITNYNNFYEFGTGKRDPAKHAHSLTTSPWNIEVSGHCNKPGVVNLEDFISPHQLEERIYRFRCVEAWSMVIPWLGVSLADVLKRFEPTMDAKFVKFTTLYRPEEMPGQKRKTLKWPYVEGLTLAEAMHPLSFLAVGLYGKELPNQNGAPLRLVVPWKYGFKNIKSIVKIEFTATEPKNSWQLQAPNEYGFYANVNPQVDHPRWSQKRERIIGKGSFFAPEKQDTMMFNGYDEVASLYTGLDLTRYY